MSDGMGSVAQNAAGVMPAWLSGAIIAGFDVHLRQITFDCLDSRSGEVTRGRIASEPAAGAGLGRAVLRSRGACRDRGVHGLAVRCSRGPARRWRAAPR